MKKLRKYIIQCKDLLMSVEEFGCDEIKCSKINQIDKISLEIAKLSMGVLVRKGFKCGYPKSDDQDLYRMEYFKQQT